MKANAGTSPSTLLREQRDSGADRGWIQDGHVGANPNDTGAGHLNPATPGDGARAIDTQPAATGEVIPMGELPPKEEDAGQVGVVTLEAAAGDSGADPRSSDYHGTAVRPGTLLNVYASTYESVQALRMAQMNRMRCSLRDSIPREQWGDIDFSDEKLNDRKLYAALPNDQREFVDQIVAMEDSAERYLGREISKHPLWPWFAATRGIGEVLAGRLIHHLGDLQRFPSPAHLWSYCGLDGPDWRRKTPEGRKTYSPKLNRLAWQCAESFQMQRVGASGYREVYDRRKAYEASRPWCGGCWPKGADKTSNREACTPGHINNKARRFTAKRFLADLWEQGQRVNAD